MLPTTSVCWVLPVTEARHVRRTGVTDDGDDDIDDVSSSDTETGELVVMATGLPWQLVVNDINGRMPVVTTLLPSCKFAVTMGEAQLVFIATGMQRLPWQRGVMMTLLLPWEVAMETAVVGVLLVTSCAKLTRVHGDEFTADVLGDLIMLSFIFSHFINFYNNNAQDKQHLSFYHLNGKSNLVWDCKEVKHTSHSISDTKKSL